MLWSLGEGLGGEGVLSREWSSPYSAWTITFPLVGQLLKNMQLLVTRTRYRGQYVTSLFCVGTVLNKEKPLENVVLEVGKLMPLLTEAI